MPIKNLKNLSVLVLKLKIIAEDYFNLIPIMEK